MGSNEQHLDPLEGGVQPGEAAGEYVMSVPGEVFIYQRHSGEWHGQGIFVIANIQGQGDTKTVNDRTTINL